MNSEFEANIFRTAQLLENASRAAAFTGAGISVESGIPPFRGENGLWNRYDPSFLEIGFFREKPAESWALIKEIFYDYFGAAKPNFAHTALAQMEEAGLLQTIITQNIDNLHQQAGSRNVLEFHGHSRTLLCVDCSCVYSASDVSLNTLPPRCEKCGGILKPEFIFFGEGIPEPAHTLSFKAASEADVFILVGSTGEIMPASMIPYKAKENGAVIIEINPAASNYTHTLTDIFLQGKAVEVFRQLAGKLNLKKGQADG